MLNIEKDHRVLWVNPEEYTEKMYTEFQRYALNSYINHLKEKRFIEKAIEVMKFNIPDEDKDLISHVKMREYGIANNQTPLLMTVGLQSCIALVAYERNFSFLAHMNVAGDREQDFEMDSTREVTRCKRIEDLYNEILKTKAKITSPISIGLVTGVTPVEREHRSRQIIERDLLKMFENLRMHNISAVRLPDINSFSFILDSRTGNIIHDGIENKNRVTNIVSKSICGTREDKSHDSK